MRSRKSSGTKVSLVEQTYPTPAGPSPTPTPTAKRPPFKLKHPSEALTQTAEPLKSLTNHKTMRCRPAQSKLKRPPGLGFFRVGQRTPPALIWILEQHGPRKPPFFVVFTQISDRHPQQRALHERADTVRARTLTFRDAIGKPRKQHSRRLIARHSAGAHQLHQEPQTGSEGTVAADPRACGGVRGVRVDVLVAGVSPAARVLVAAPFKKLGGDGAIVQAPQDGVQRPVFGHH